jgi:hypothetical protein
MAHNGSNTPDTCTMADLLRLSSLRRFGGFYFDCDFIPLHPMSYLLSKYNIRHKAFLTKQWGEGPKRIANGVIGLPKDGQVWDKIDSLVEEQAEAGIERTSFGPLLTTRLTIEFPDVVIGEIDDFYRIRFNPKGAAMNAYVKLVKQDFSPKIVKSVFGHHVPFAMHLWMGRKDYKIPALNTLAKTARQPAKALDRTKGNGSKKLAVACVLKKGREYSPLYVEKLVKACERTLTKEHEFFCLTDYEGELPCNKVKLRHNWPGWWSKIELFRPDIFADFDRVIYFDLDTVLVSSIDNLATHPCRFAMLHGFRKPERRASGVMVWEGDVSGVYFQMVKAQRRILADPEAWDQVFIAEQVREYYCEPDVVQEMMGGVVSYKNHVWETGNLPEGARVVCFHGQPRPKAVERKHPWMKRCW